MAMNRIEKMPRECMTHGKMLHLMTPGTALRWATVHKRSGGFQVYRADLRCEIQSTVTVSSLHLAATLAKRFAREAA